MNDPLEIQEQLREIAELFFADQLGGEDVAAHALDLAAGSLDEYSRIVTYRLRDRDFSWHEDDCQIWLVGVLPERWEPDTDGEGIDCFYACQTCGGRTKGWRSADWLPRNTRVYFFPEDDGPDRAN